MTEPQKTKQPIKPAPKQNLNALLGILFFGLCFFLILASAAIVLNNQQKAVECVKSTPDPEVCVKLFGEAQPERDVYEDGDDE